jgi:hypothetical protein
MAEAFSLTSWNVEHFEGEAERAQWIKDYSDHGLLPLVVEQPG